MKLVQALGKSSLIIDNTSDTEVALSPNYNGGCEFGTWNFPEFIFTKVENRFNVKKPYECGCGVQICHRFTSEECDILKEYLDSFERKTIDIDGEKINAVVVNQNGERKFISQEFHKNLTDMFCDKEDLPVFYFAG